MSEPVYDPNADQEHDLSHVRSAEENADDTLYSGAQKFANGEDLNDEEAAAAKDRLGLERPANSAAQDIKDQLGRGYTTGGDKTKISNRYNSNSNFKKKLAIAGAAAGGSALGGMLIFFALLPLKIESIVKNLENRYQATTKAAVQQETRSAFNAYIKNYVLRGLHAPGCTSTRTDKDCVDISSCKNPTNPVCKLYKGWKQARLEKSLADKYGIEFGNSHGRLYMKAPGLPNTAGLPDGSIDVTNIENSNESIFSLGPVKRTEAQKMLDNALADKTLWQKTLFRFRYGKLIQTKYGWKPCLFTACRATAAARNNWADFKANKKDALKMATIERVIRPRSAALADAVTCLMDPNCKPEDRSDGGDGSATPDDPASGEIQSVAEKEVQTELDQAAGGFATRSFDTLAKEVDKFNKAGNFIKYIITTVLEKFGVSALTTEFATKFAGPIGWINTAFGMIGNIANLGPKVRDFNYAIKAASYVEYAGIFTTAIAQLHAGVLDPNVLQSIAEGLSAGGHDATESPYYAWATGNSNTSLTSAFGGLGSLAYADGQSSSAGSNCSNGKPIPPGQYICPLFSLNSTTTVTAAIESVSGAIPGPVGQIANLWNSTVGSAFSYVSGVGCKVASPVCKAFSDAIGGAIGPIFSWVVGTLFPAVISPDMPGDQAIVAIGGGIGVASYDFAHHGLGGQLLTGQQASMITNDWMAADKANFNDRPMFARLFSTDTPYSLVSRLAVAMPANLTTFVSSSTLQGFLGGQFSRLFAGIADMFPGSHAFAAVPHQMDDPIGESAYGYLPGDPTFSVDPDKEWDNVRCDDTSAGGPTAQWNMAATNHINNETGQAENTTTNPCLLVQGMAEANGVTSDASIMPASFLNNDPVGM